MQIPTTRAKSPKLGRRKSLPPGDSEGNSNAANPSSRLIVDEKVSQNPTKGSLVHLKKPQRKSLPTLPSEKASFSNAVNGRKANASKAHVEKTIHAKNEDKTSYANEEQTIPSNATIEAGSCTQEQEGIHKAEAGETQVHTDESQMVEGQYQPTLAQESVALEL